MIPEAWNCGTLPAGARIVTTSGTKTGWPPGMLQDDERKLSIWLANRIDSRRHAREAASDLATMQADVTTVRGLP